MTQTTAVSAISLFLLLRDKDENIVLFRSDQKLDFQVPLVTTHPNYERVADRFVGEWFPGERPSHINLAAVIEYQVDGKLLAVDGYILADLNVRVENNEHFEVLSRDEFLARKKEDFWRFLFINQPRYVIVTSSEETKANIEHRSLSVGQRNEMHERLLQTCLVKA